MKICYVADSIIPSRTANSIHVMKMCAALGELGHNVLLLVPKRNTSEDSVDNLYTYYGVSDSFEIHRNATPYWHKYRLAYFSLGLTSLALRTRPDLVYTRTMGVAWGLTNIFHRPVLYETHQPWTKSGRQQSLFRQTINSRSLLALVVITQALDSMLTYRPKYANVLVAHDGVDDSALGNKMSKMEARSRLGLDVGQSSLAVYTGHMYKGRGVELIIELAQKLSTHEFILVGGTEKDIAHYRGLSGDRTNLHFIGFVPPSEVSLYLHAADVLLMPYADIVETASGASTGAWASPMKMFEYMASWRPIISSTLPVLKEVLRDGENALLLSYDRPDLWCDALLQLKAVSEIGERLARQALEDVRKYTWKNRAQRILDKVGPRL